VAARSTRRGREGSRKPRPQDVHTTLKVLMGTSSAAIGEKAYKDLVVIFFDTVEKSSNQEKVFRPRVRKGGLWGATRKGGRVQEGAAGGRKKPSRTAPPGRRAGPQAESLRLPDDDHAPALQVLRRAASPRGRGLGRSVPRRQPGTELLLGAIAP